MEPDDAPAVKDAIAGRLTGLVDPAQDTVAIRGVAKREQLNAGPYAAESPDLVVKLSEGYRASWSTALGGMAEGHFAPASWTPAATAAWRVSFR